MSFISSNQQHQSTKHLLVPNRNGVTELMQTVKTNYVNHC